jgi:histidyl-tRNA synthetase
MLLAAGEQAVAVPVVDLFVAYAEPQPGARATAFRIAHRARRAGLDVQMELAGRSSKGQLKQADRIGARFVAIVGEEGVTVKDRESGEQDELAPDAVIAAVLRGRKLG